MAAGSGIPSSPPPLWQLNSTTHEPEKLTTLCTALEYLIKNQTWVEKNPQKAKEYFDRLEITNFTSISNFSIQLTPRKSDTLISIYQKVLSLREKVFPLQEKDQNKWVKIGSGNEAVQIPKNLLAALSPKFDKAMSHSGMADSKAGMFDITETSIDSKIVRSFVEYLKDGEIILTGDNVLPLFHLAKEHMVPKLEKLCVEFLKKNIELENIDEESFETFCQFASQEDAEWLSDILLRSSTKKAEGLGIRLNLDHKEIFIDESASPEAWKFLHTLGQLHIKLLTVYSDSSSDTKLKELDLSLNFPYLKQVDCNSCALTTLIAPQVDWVRSRFCEDLTVLNALKATRVECQYGKSLPELTLPEATYVDCSNCKVLTKLDAPKATEVLRFKTPELTNMNVPSTAVIKSQR